jgi:putative membrane protein insertion efficiency factor
MKRGSKAMLLAVLGLTVYLIGESFLPAGLQPSARLLGAAIDGYQLVGSPTVRAMGGRCRYTPTCSHYAEDAISHYGTLGGATRTAGRLWRCSPWGGEGYDPAFASLHPQQETPEERKARQDAERQMLEQQKKAQEEMEKAFRELGQHTGEAAAGGIVCCIIWIATILIGVGIQVFMMVFTYKDAKARGDQNAVIWLILIFFLHWIGLVVYLIARPKGDLAPCANCKNKMMTTLAKCPHCGTDTGAAAAPPPKA